MGDGMNDPYNATTLDGELRAAGLRIHGCSSRGRIDWVSPPTAAEEKKAEAVLKAHDKTKLPAKEARLGELREKRRSGKPLTAAEQQEMLDHLMGV